MRIAGVQDGTTELFYEYDENVRQTGQGNFSKVAVEVGGSPVGESTGRYDDFNRLREVTHPDDQLDQYAYTHQGLRFRRVEDVNRDNGDTVITYTMYSGNDILLQDVYTDDGGGPTLIESRLNLIAPGGRAIVGQYRKVYAGSEELRFCATDQLGSIRVVYDDDGVVEDNFTYSAYGEKEHTTQTHEFLSLFTGKQYDASGLMYFNARYYTPSTGRFVTEDPMRDGLNWYLYAAGNPLRYTDPRGTQVVAAAATIAVGGALFLTYAAAVTRTTVSYEPRWEAGRQPGWWGKTEGSADLGNIRERSAFGSGGGRPPLKTIVVLGTLASAIIYDQKRRQIEDPQRELSDRVAEFLRHDETVMVDSLGVDTPEMCQIPGEDDASAPSPSWYVPVPAAPSYSPGEIANE